VINPSGCSDPTNVMVTYTYDFDRIAQSSIHNLQSGDALGSVRQVADAGGAIRLDRNMGIPNAEISVQYGFYLEGYN